MGHQQLESITNAMVRASTLLSKDCELKFLIAGAGWMSKLCNKFVIYLKYNERTIRKIWRPCFSINPFIVKSIFWSQSHQLVALVASVMPPGQFWCQFYKHTTSLYLRVFTNVFNIPFFKKTFCKSQICMGNTSKLKKPAYRPYLIQWPLEKIQHW